MGFIAGRRRSVTLVAAGAALLSCCCVSARACRAQTPARGLDVTGALRYAPMRPLSLGAVARDPLAFDPLTVMGFRPGRDVDLSRVPATRLLGGLLGALVAHRGRLSIRSEFLEGEGGRFSAGVVSNRRVGSGVGLTWSY